MRVLACGAVQCPCLRVHLYRTCYVMLCLAVLLYPASWNLASMHPVLLAPTPVGPHEHNV